MRYCPRCERQFEDDLRVCPEDGADLFEVPESAAAKHVGRVLDGRWTLESIIGEGAMGAVFRAAQARTGQVAAIKIIQARSFSETELVSRFFREAQVLSSLQHPHIVRLLDFGQDSDSKLFFIAMELLQGQSLAAAAPDLALDELVAVMEQLADALAQTHAQGIVHRDLKPENLFVNRLRGGGIHLTVLDFGIAKMDEGQMAKLTATGSIQGTPHYMAPEQIQGQSVGPLTDLYSLGCILYELLAGVEPFVGDTVMAVLVQHLHGTAPPLSAAWSRPERVHAELIALTESLMARDPGGRPQSALAVHAALRRLRMSLQGSVAGHGSTPTAIPSTGLVPPAPPPPPASTAPRSRAAWAMGLAGAAAAVVVSAAAGIYVALSAPAPPPLILEPPPIVPRDAGIPEGAAATVAPEIAVSVDAGLGPEAAVPAIEAMPVDVVTDDVDEASGAPADEAGRGRPRRRPPGSAPRPKDDRGLGDVLKGMRSP